MNKLKLLDLFSGIGGFSLGLESTGYFQTIAFVEKDKFCRQVLQKNFNNIPIEEDIRNVRGSNYAADVITGGFPCQPFSVAGKRKGTADDRYLWDETIRVVAECKPRWFIGENVEGLININNGMVLRQVQTDLEEQGFQVQCIVIPASGIGAWHQRKRIWIVAYSHNNGSYRSQRNETEQSCNKQEDRLSFRDDKDVPNTDTGFGIRENQEIQTGGNTIVNGSEDVSNSNSRMCGGRGTEFQSRDDREWWFYSEKEKQTRMTFGAKLSDAMIFLEKQLYNTPTTNDAKNLTFPKSQTNRTSIVGNLIQQEQIKPGGKLNPNFVEFLMGYPMNWTKIDQAE
jgi:DNA-cytosine methyltransferase